MHLPGESGIAGPARWREKLPQLQVSMLTVYKDIKMIFQALKAGACGHVLKRSDDREILDAIAEVRAGGAPMTSEIARMVVSADGAGAIAPAGSRATERSYLGCGFMELPAPCSQHRVKMRLESLRYINPSGQPPPGEISFACGTGAAACFGIIISGV